MNKLLQNLLIIYCAFLGFNWAQAQFKPISGTEGIGVALVDKYKPNADSVKNNGWEGCVFIRFNISKSGRFGNIGYTASTLVFIKDAITKAFERIDIKDLDMTRFKKMPGRTFLLPFMIQNKDGCGFMTGWEDKNYKPDEKITSRQITYHQSASSIENITRFTDGTKLDFIDCILPAPVSTGCVILIELTP